MKHPKLHLYDLARSNFAKISLLILFVLSIWQIIYHMNWYNQSLFPSPIQVGRSFVEMLKSGEWYEDSASSIGRYFAGFTIGSFLGILLGVITGRVFVVRTVILPLFNFFRSIPSIALIPLAITWWGIGEQEKVIIIAWGVLFPIWLNTHSGISKIEIEYIWAAKSLGCKRWKLIQNVYLPRAIPFIIAGTRIAIATGFFSLAAAEMAGAFNGVAYRIFYSHQIFRTDKMLVAIFTIGFFSLLFDRLFILLIDRFLPWWKTETDDER